MDIEQVEERLWRVTVPWAPIEYAETPSIAVALASFWKTRIAFEQSQLESHATLRSERDMARPDG